METKRNLRKYNKADCISFRSTKGNYGGLSNMAGGFPLNLENIKIYNAEALYQSLKYPNHPNIQEEIFAVKSPIFAKKISRKYSKFERKDWIQVRFKIMRYCIELKLEQNFIKFSEVLLSTKNKSIVEYTKTDKIWGAIDVGAYYEGTNALGRLLMELRGKLDCSKGYYHAALPDVPDLVVLNKDLKTIS